MRLTAIVMTVALAANFAYGQSTPAEAKPPQVSHENFEAEVIHVKTLTGDSFNRLLSMLSVFDAKVRGDENLRTIIVYAPKDVVVQMRRIITELDTPGSEAAIGRNIEMTLTLLRCSTKTPGTTKLPDDIELVAKQLRAATQYKDIQLWDVIPLRLQEGKETTSDLQLPVSEGPSANFNIRIVTEAATRKERNWSVRFKEVRLFFGIPVARGTGSDGKPAYTFQQVGLNTAGDFLEGQKTVLGKVSGAESDTAIFAVVSLKVLE